MTDVNIDQIISHLEFLGYEVKVNEPNKDGVVVVAAMHPQKSNFLFRPYLAGFLFQLWYSTNESTKERRTDFLEYINNLNKCASTTRAYCNDDMDLVIEAWLPEKYEKVSFGQFLESWDNDTRAKLADDARTDSFLT